MIPEHVAGQIKRFQERAIATEDERMRARYIDVVDMLICDLQTEGVIDDATADRLSRAWVMEYSERRGFIPLFVARN